MIPIRDDNPTRHPPYLTIALIAINVVVFLWEISGGELENSRRVFRYSTVPYNLTANDGEAALLIMRDRFAPVRAIPGVVTDDGIKAIDPAEGNVVPVPPQSVEEVVTQPTSPWLTVLFSMFMHGGWMHLIGNMWFLWIFGNNVEDATKGLRFLSFYLLSGIVASAAHIISDPSSPIPSLGASGAISGVLGGYLVLYPKARILTFLPLGYFWTTYRIPAALFLPIWLAFQLIGVAQASGGVAWWAHIGGFVAGAALIKIFETGEHRERNRARGLPISDFASSDFRRRSRWP